MYFDWNWQINDFLFENFNIDTLEKCLLVIFIVFCMAYSTELIKMFQKVLNKKVQTSWSNSTDHGETTPLVSSLRIPSESEIKKRKIQNHAIQSLMYMLNLTIGYFLMLIAMGMYSGHFLAIVLGIGFGYYFLHILTPDFYESISNKSIGINEDEHLPRSSNYEQI